MATVTNHHPVQALDSFLPGSTQTFLLETGEIAINQEDKWDKQASCGCLRQALLQTTVLAAGRAGQLGSVQAVSPLGQVPLVRERRS